MTTWNFINTTTDSETNMKVTQMSIMKADGTLHSASVSQANLLILSVKPDVCIIATNAKHELTESILVWFNLTHQPLEVRRDFFHF